MAAEPVKYKVGDLLDISMMGGVSTHSAEVLEVDEKDLPKTVKAAFSSKPIPVVNLSFYRLSGKGKQFSSILH